MLKCLFRAFGFNACSHSWSKWILKRYSDTQTAYQIRRCVTCGKTQIKKI